MFEEEKTYYAKHKTEYLKHHENSFVALRDSQLLGAYTTELEAYEAGLAAWGNVPFLIRRVSKEEEFVRFPALSVGVVNDNS